MDFRNRLKKATDRGQRARDEKLRAEQAEALSEEEFRRLHSSYRLPLSEHIENCLEKVADNFPGFRFETIVDESGWGAAVSRDDIKLDQGGRRNNQYSRLEMTVRPFSKAHVLDLAAKGTVRNREVFSRNHFEKLEEADSDNFAELIDLWVLEYAELYAAQK